MKKWLLATVAAGCLLLVGCGAGHAQMHVVPDPTPAPAPSAPPSAPGPIMPGAPPSTLQVRPTGSSQGNSAPPTGGGVFGSSPPPYPGFNLQALLQNGVAATPFGFPTTPNPYSGYMNAPSYLGPQLNAPGISTLTGQMPNTLPTNTPGLPSLSPTGQTPTGTIPSNPPGANTLLGSQQALS